MRDLRHRFAGNCLQVANHANRRFDHQDNLRFPLRLLAADEFPLTVEILAHVVELLDDGLDALTEFVAGQIMIDLLHLGLLPLLHQARTAYFDQTLTKGGRRDRFRVYARLFAAAAKSPPLGERSWGPQRGTSS